MCGHRYMTLIGLHDSTFDMTILPKSPPNSYSKGRIVKHVMLLTNFSVFVPGMPREREREIARESESESESEREREGGREGGRERE
jgi:hypothetical protein